MGMLLQYHRQVAEKAAAEVEKAEQEPRKRSRKVRDTEPEGE